MGLSSSYSNFPTLKVDIRIFDRGGCLFKAWGGGGTPLYKPYRYVSPHRVGVFAPFWSENWYRLIFDRNRVWLSRGLRECMNVFIVSVPNK